MNKRLEELEAGNRTLREQLEACEEQPEELERLDQKSELETGVASKDNSIWARVRRFVRDVGE